MAFPDVTLGEARTRMRYLMGESLTLPASTTAQANGWLTEAYRIWFQVNKGYPCILITSSALTIAAGAFKTTLAGFNPGTLFTVKASEILSVHVTAITAVALERISVDEIIYLQNAVGETGTPTKCAIMHAETSASIAAESDWFIYCYPIPTGSTTLVFRALYHPADLAVDSHTLRLPDHEAWAVCRIAAAIGAGVLQRSRAVIDELWRPVPEAIQALARVTA